MSLRPKPEIENIEVYPHGGINRAELSAIGLTPEAVLDFSVCTNPFMPPPGIKKILSAIPIGQYPDSEATELRQHLSKVLGLPPENILVGSGTTELIRLIALTYFGHGDRVLIPEPTYGEYQVACQIVGAEPIKLWGGEEDNFTLKIGETTNLIGDCHPRGVFVCNPNNPTGKYLSREDIEIILNSIGDGLLILDEAYVSFVSESWSSADLISRDDVIILRSMTKDYGLAGLRLGYALASRKIISSLRKVCPPWNVNAIAQKVGTVLLETEDYLEQSKTKIRESKQFLMDELSRLNFPLLRPSGSWLLDSALLSFFCFLQIFCLHLSR